MLEIKVKKIGDVALPQKFQNGDWVDLRSAESVNMKAGEFRAIRLGIAMKLPDGYEAHVVPRSSTFKKYKIIQTNSVGIIDNSYSGNSDEWRFPVIASEETFIEKGDRICQFRIVKTMPKILITEVENLSGKNRGGFGSTGVK